MIILYTGIHYDALAVSPGKGISGEFDQTAFEGPAAEKVLSAAVELARKWNKVGGLVILLTVINVENLTS